MQPVEEVSESNPNPNPNPTLTLSLEEVRESVRESARVLVTNIDIYMHTHTTTYICVGASRRDTRVLTSC